MVKEADHSSPCRGFAARNDSPCPFSCLHHPIQEVPARPGTPSACRSRPDMPLPFCCLPSVSSHKLACKLRLQRLRRQAVWCIIPARRLRFLVAWSVASTQSSSVASPRFTHCSTTTASLAWTPKLPRLSHRLVQRPSQQLAFLPVKGKSIFKLAKSRQFQN